MHERSAKVFSDHLLLGGLVTAAGSAAGLWFPTSFAILLGGLALCRICWIEDNIHHDLLHAEQIPTGYRTCRTRRQNVLGRQFSDDLTNTECPRLLASQLRVQGHAWAAFGWALLAGAVLVHAAAISVVVSMLCLLMALRNADYFAWGQTALIAGRPLPDRLIAGRGPLSRFAYSTRRPD